MRLENQHRQRLQARALASKMSHANRSTSIVRLGTTGKRGEMREEENTETPHLSPELNPRGRQFADHRRLFSAQLLCFEERSTKLDSTCSGGGGSSLALDVCDGRRTRRATSRIPARSGEHNGSQTQDHDAPKSTTAAPQGPQRRAPARNESRPSADPHAELWLVHLAGPDDKASAGTNPQIAVGPHLPCRHCRQRHEESKSPSRSQSPGRWGEGGGGDAEPRELLPGRYLPPPSLPSQTAQQRR